MEPFDKLPLNRHPVVPDSYGQLVTITMMQAISHAVPMTPEEEA